MGKNVFQVHCNAYIHNDGCPYSSAYRDTQNVSIIRFLIVPLENVREHSYERQRLQLTFIENPYLLFWVQISTAFYCVQIFISSNYELKLFSQIKMSWAYHNLRANCKKKKKPWATKKIIHAIETYKTFVTGIWQYRYITDELLFFLHLT